MADLEAVERYAVLLAMSEVALGEIEEAVSLEFCQSMAAVFKIIPAQVSFGLPPEEIHAELLGAARKRGMDAYVKKLRQRCESRCSGDVP